MKNLKFLKFSVLLIFFGLIFALNSPKAKAAWDYNAQLGGRIPDSLIYNIAYHCNVDGWSIVAAQWLSAPGAPASTTVTVPYNSTSVSMDLNYITYRCKVQTSPYALKEQAQIYNAAGTDLGTYDAVTQYPSNNARWYNLGKLRGVSYSNGSRLTSGTYNINYNNRGMFNKSNGAWYCAKQVSTDYSGTPSPFPYGKCAVGTDTFQINVTEQPPTQTETAKGTIAIVKYPSNYGAAGSTAGTQSVCGDVYSIATNNTASVGYMDADTRFCSNSVLWTAGNDFRVHTLACTNIDQCPPYGTAWNGDGIKIFGYRINRSLAAGGYQTICDLPCPNVAQDQVQIVKSSIDVVTGLTTWVDVFFTTVGKLKTAKLSTPPHTESNILKSGDTLTANKAIVSPNGLYSTLMQSDGNFVVYNRYTGAIFETCTYTNNPCGRGVGSYAKMGPDGCLRVYNSSNVEIWKPTPCGPTGSQLFMQDDGNLAIWDSTHTTNTGIGNFYWTTGWPVPGQANTASVDTEVANAPVRYYYSGGTSTWYQFESSTSNPFLRESVYTTAGKFKVEIDVPTGYTLKSAFAGTDNKLRYNQSFNFTCNGSAAGTGTCTVTDIDIKKADIYNIDFVFEAQTKYYPWLQTKQGDVVADGKIKGQVTSGDGLENPGAKLDSVKDQEAEFLIISAVGGGDNFCSTYDYILTNTNSQGGDCNNGTGYKFNSTSIDGSGGVDRVIAGVKQAFADNPVPAGQSCSSRGIATATATTATLPTLSTNCEGGIIYKMPGGSSIGLKDVSKGRVTIYVEGDLNITGYLNSTGGSQQANPLNAANLAIVATGNINIVSTMKILNAQLYAGGKINTCTTITGSATTTNECSVNQLLVKGAMSAKGGFDFKRTYIYGVTSGTISTCTASPTTAPIEYPTSAVTDTCPSELITLNAQGIAFPPPGIESRYFYNDFSGYKLDTSEYSPRF